jgi:rhodanese-related sulfurtransferase
VAQFIEFLGNHVVLSAVWVGLFVAVIVSWIKGLMSPVKAISPQKLTFMVNREDALVVDIRNKAEFDKGHITDALHLGLDKIQKKDFAALENKQSTPIIVVCNAGMSAGGASNTLSKNGFTQVSLLQGGMNAWATAGLPVTKK